VPRLAVTARHLTSGGVAPAARVAVSLRLSRIFGCPVCRQLFPALAERAGLDRDAVRAALDGRIADLAPEVAAAVAWAEAVASGDGALPTDVPEAATMLGDAQRDHLAFMVRLELVVHATGLFFLPHRWIERAALV